VHRLDAALVFTAADSGTEKTPVVWAGSMDAVVSGGEYPLVFFCAFNRNCGSKHCPLFFAISARNDEQLTGVAVRGWERAASGPLWSAELPVSHPHLILT